LLVSATNADLSDAIAKGRFRQDLLFRLNALEVTLPTLGERSDFEAIATHLLTSIDSRRSLSPAAIQHLSRCAWPGNIRELRNALSRLTLHNDDIIINTPALAAVAQHHADERRGSTLHDQHRIQVLSTYAETGNNVSETARRLGVSRNTICRVLDERPVRR